MRQKIESYIKELFADDSSGHDYFHAIRVYNIAMKIAEHESCDKEIVMLGALLHDADDKKYCEHEGTTIIYGAVFGGILRRMGW